VKTIRGLADKNKDENYEWTDADQRAWDAANTEIDEVNRNIESGGTGSDAYGREDRVGNGGVDDDTFQPREHKGEVYRDTYTGRLVPVVRGSESFADAVASVRGRDWQEARRDRYEGLSLGRMLRALATGTDSDLERRALAEGTDSAGGYTVPDILSTTLIDRMRAKSRVMQAGASTVPLASDKQSFAKLLTDPTPGWRAENAAVAESDPTFGTVAFVPKTLAVLFRASQELLEDSVNIEQAINTSLAQSLANEVDRVALLGSGSGSEPTGMASMSGGINELSMGTNGAAISDFTDVLDAVKLMQDDNAGDVGALIMAPRTHRVFAGLADTTGQPLRRPFSIENIPFLETSQVPIDQTQGTAGNASSIYLGDFADLVIGVRSRLQVEVLKERYADNMQVGFLIHLRADIQAWREQSLCRIVGIIP